MNSAGVRGVCIRSPGQGRATATPFVRLPGQKRRVDEFAEDRDIHNNAFPLQEFASAATTLGFLGDTPTEVFASAGLLLTAAGILVAEVLQSSADTRVNKDAGAICRILSDCASLLDVTVVRSSRYPVPETRRHGRCPSFCCCCCTAADEGIAGMIAMAISCMQHQHQIHHKHELFPNRQNHRPPRSL